MEYKDINDYEVLYLVEENQSDYKEILFKKYEPVLKKITYDYFFKMKRLGVEYDDIYQEALIGLNYAIDHFNFQKDVKFYTYAILCVKSKLNSYYFRSNNGKNKILNDSMVFMQMNDMDMESLISVRFNDTYLYFYDEILKFKNNLNEMQAQVFELKYNGFTNSDIGNLLGLTVKDVYYYLCLIRKKLIMNNF